MNNRFKHTFAACLVALTGMGAPAFAQPSYLYKVFIPGLSAASSVASSSTGLVQSGASRNYADGTYATSCYNYLTGTGNHAYSGFTGDGIYSISVSGSGVIPVYCDMTTDGGGWTLIVKALAGSNAHANVAAVGTLTSPTQTTAAKLSDAVINAIPTTMYRMSNNARTVSVYFDTSDSFASTREVASKASKTWSNPSWKGPFYDSYQRGFNTYDQSAGSFGVSDTVIMIYTGQSSSDSCRLGFSTTTTAWCGNGDSGTAWLR